MSEDAGYAERYLCALFATVVKPISDLRLLISGLCALPLALSVPAQAQQQKNVPRVGLLMSSSTAETAPFIEAFRQGLRELGYIEGKNIVLEIRWGEAKPDRVSDLAAELIGLKVDIIVAGGNFAVRGAMKATSTIPIVIRTATDPVSAGFVSSLARPDRNITGVTSIKGLELLAEVVSGVKRVGVLVPYTDPARFMARDDYKEMEAAARVLGVKLQLLPARDPDTIDNAFLAMTKERAQALVVTPSASYLQHRAHLENTWIRIACRLSIF